MTPLVRVVGNCLFVTVVFASSAWAAPTFAPRVDYRTGASPQAAAVADLNGDGIPDVTWTNYGLTSNTVSVALGTGGGTFGARADYAAGSNPATIAIGDLNHDGLPDLVVSNWSSANVSVLLGTGGGAFGAAAHYSTGSGRPICGRLADLNGDGHLDVVVADWSSNVLKRLLGNGAGGLGAATSYAAGSHPYGLALGDLNGDGRLDAVAANRSTTNISVLLGTVSGGFGAASSVTVGSDPIWVALSDVSGDGALDAVVTNFTSNTLSVLPGNGGGGFGARTDYATGAQPLSVGVSDLDLDGALDAVVSDYAGQALSLFAGLGGGAFTPRVAVTTAAGPAHLAIADVSGDGWPDLLVPCAVAESLAVHLNTGPPLVQVPSAANSTCPTRVTTGAHGDCCFDVIVRDLANNPIAGSNVVVDFSACAIDFCPSQPPGIIVNGIAKTARTSSDSSGSAHLCICTLNAVAGCTAAIYADGVLLCNVLPVSSCPADSECAAGQWRIVANSGPSPRFDTALASDYDYENILLFGGTDGLTTFGDTWRWDGISWSQLSPGVTPPARSRHAMTYDRVRRRVVMFGGFSGTGALGDTWEFDRVSGTWALVSAFGPPARWGHELAYDENRGRVVMFGGFDGGFLGDTWEWDGTSWTPVTGGTAPSARADFGMTFDQESGLTMLHGGSSAAGTESDLWLYDGTYWFEMPADPDGPGARSGHALMYGAEGGNVVLYGGVGPDADQHAWRWTGGRWVDLPDGVMPQIGHAMAYDHFNDHMLLFGGFTGPVLMAPLGDTWEWCSPCPDVYALLDSLGEVIVPAGGDPLAWNNPEADDSSTPTGTLYPGTDTSTDEWLDNLPCNPSIGGEPDSVDTDDPWDEDAVELGLETLTEQAFTDSISTWSERVSEIVANSPPPITDSTAAGGNYVALPLQPCPPADLSLAFGGRDIVFVHGYRTTPIQEKMFGTNDSATVDWVRTNGSPGWTANPSFYGGMSQYWSRGAYKYWQPHIKKFLSDKGYKNRYLVVSWSSNQPLWTGVHAILTQVSDAMIHGQGVVDPSNGQLGANNFGSRGLVFVSHSTGGPITDVTLAAAANLPWLNAQFIAERAKAHVAIDAAFGGSYEATMLLGITRHSVIANAFQGGHDMCVLVNQMLGASGSNCDGWPQPEAPWSGVSVDLDPATMLKRWGQFMQMVPTRTVTIAGGHPSFYKFAKAKLLPGQDDGVVNMNAQTANPLSNEFWPSGYLRVGPRKVAGRAVVDVGLSPPRKRGYRRDQLRDAKKADPLPGWPEHWDRFLTRVASGSTDKISPTGMLQPWHLPTATPVWVDSLNPNLRYPRHYSFVQGAIDHFSLTLNWSDLFDQPSSQTTIDYNDQWSNGRYTPTKGHANTEEVRVINDDAIYDNYGPSWDTAPLLNRNSSVVTDGLAQVEVKGSKCVRKHPGRKCRLALRKRTYQRLIGWETKMACDYAYDLLLRDRPMCDLHIGGADTPVLSGTRGWPNPFRGEANIEFTTGLRAAVQLEVYDSQGRRVRKLLAQSLEPGRHALRWDARGDSGRRLPSGLYLWRLRVDGAEKASGKLLLLN